LDLKCWRSLHGLMDRISFFYNNISDEHSVE
jgi:hypothetical protein